MHPYMLHPWLEPVILLLNVIAACMWLFSADALTRHEARGALELGSGVLHGTRGLGSNRCALARIGGVPSRSLRTNRRDIIDERRRSSR